MSETRVRGWEDGPYLDDPTLNDAAKGIIASMRDRIGELNKRLAEARAEVERLNKMKAHCEHCGGDYLQTGVESGCPCRLKADNERLRGALANMIKYHGAKTHWTASAERVWSETKRD